MLARLKVRRAVLLRARLPSGAIGSRSFSDDSNEEWHKYQKWHLGFQEVKIPAYGDEVMPLNQIASINSNVDGSFEVVPWDAESTGGAIRASLSDTAVGLKVLAGVDHQINLVLDAEAEFASTTTRASFEERMENEYDWKARVKKEKRTARQGGKLQIYQMLDTFAWTELPPAAQDMYSTLGWTAKSWKDGTAVTEDLPWHELSALQQESALMLGYAQDDWDDWGDLSPEQQALWNVLGWNSENWNTDGAGVDVEDIAWGDLTAEQLEAAEGLGFVQDSWDDFEDLTAEKQALWGALGWTSENWKDNTHAEGVESENTSWDELSATQRAAAVALGFDQDTWDEWSDLPAEKQALWETLGWSAENWSTGVDVATEKFTWIQLSQSQREAAEDLGYAQDDWDDWADLPGDKQELWGQLGWNSENWSSGTGAATENLEFVDLTKEQQAAAEALGIPQDAWDGNWAEW